MRAIPYTAILAELTSDAVLDTAYDWLCNRRRDYPADADVWSFRQGWAQEMVRVKAELVAGRYRFGLLTRVTLKDGEDVDLWSACDALVLKALTIALAKHLPVSARCTHVKGHGGAKAAVRRVMARLADNRFVLKTDVKSYYASIDHFLDQLAVHIKDKAVLNLLGQYMRRTVDQGGWFWEYERGSRLYEQEPRDAISTSRFGMYVRRWVAWSSAGLSMPSPACVHLPPGRLTNLTGAYRLSCP